MSLPTKTDGAAPGLLIVDDDLRNTFALASALEQYQMRVVPAENGKDGIEVLKGHPGIDVVLMDHAAVAQALAFAMPHPKLGEEVADDVDGCGHGAGG